MPGAPIFSAITILAVGILVASAEPESAHPSRVRDLLEALEEPGSRTVLIAAHRGGHVDDLADQAPENSVANIETALARGFDCYETDIRRTADGVFVVVHDATLDRETDGEGPVEALTYEQVNGLRKRFRDGSLSQEPVATLEALLTAGRRRILFKPDLKPGVIEHFGELAALIDRLDMNDEVFLRTGGKDADAIAAHFEAGVPRVEVMFKVDTVAQVKSIASRFSPRTIQINIAKNEAISPEKRETIRVACELGMVVETHAYSDTDQWADLLRAGVRFFHTASPDATLAWLEKHRWREAFAGPIALGSGRHLFLDDRLIDHAKSHGISRRMNPPRHFQRILKPDQPWEALGFIFYASVVDHEGTAMLYYGTYDAEKGKHLCLATSKDGLEWERPELDLVEHEGSTANNIFPMEAVEAGVFLDPAAPADRRFRLLHNRNWPDPEKAGVYLSHSPDGIHWTPLKKRLFPRVPDSQPSAYRDPKTGAYGIYLRAWDPKRSIARVETDNLEGPWPFDESVPPHHVWGKEKVATISRELPVVMRPDALDPANVQLYTSNVFRYPWAEDAYFAFPASYFLYRGSPLEHLELNGNDGTFDIQFATSRDGVWWKRHREPWIQPDAIDSPTLQLVSMGTGIIRRGDKLHQYFIGWPHTHGRPVVWDTDLEDREAWLKKDLGGIYRATSRVDGFVSINDSENSDPGVFTTRLVTFSGNQLRLNIDTSNAGWATVALRDANGEPIAGFTEAEAIKIKADAINHVVTWKGDPDLTKLADIPIRLQITQKNASLHAIEFANQ